MPTTLTGVTFGVGDSCVVLAWTPVTGATGYNVYRSTTGKLNYIKVSAKQTTPYYVDLGVINGAPYEYTVTVLAGDRQIWHSPVVTATPSSQGGTLVAVKAPGAVMASTTIATGSDGTSYTATLANKNSNFFVLISFSLSGVLAAPANIQVTSRNGEIVLTWDGSDGATGYNLYRADSPSGPYVRIQSNYIYDNHDQYNAVTGKHFYVYTDTELTNGKHYYYRISSIGPGGEANEAQAGRWDGIDIPLEYSGDRSHLAAMLIAFRDPPNAKYWDTAFVTRMTLMHSFALLGATEALPVLDDALADDLDRSRISVEDNIAIIQNVKAIESIIKVQSGVAGIKDPKKRAAAQIKQYLQELGITPDSINKAVAAWAKAHTKSKNVYVRSISYPLEEPVELYAMREIADMIYHGQASDYAGVPEVTQIDFTLDPGAGLKYQLAPLSLGQRIHTLIEMLAADKEVDGKAHYAEQLLSDMGEAARPAITAKLEDINLHPGQYSDQAGNEDGLGLLNNVIGAINLQQKGQWGHKFVGGY